MGPLSKIRSKKSQRWGFQPWSSLIQAWYAKQNCIKWVRKWARNAYYSKYQIGTKMTVHFFLRNLRGIPWSLPRLMFQANKSLPPPLVLLTGLESLANRLMISRASLAKNPPSNPAGAFIKPRIILVMKLWVPPLRCVVLKESTWKDY